MKKFVKILSLILVFAIVLAPVVSLAEPFKAQAGGGDIKGLGAVENLTGKAITILQYIGYAVAVVMVLWLGIQWMIAQPAKKAELKGKMWSMAIGILLLVGGVTILSVVWNAFESGTQQLN